MVTPRIKWSEDENIKESPELAGLSEKYIHQPWTAPLGILAAAGIELGRDYPAPIVDLAESRREALAAWEAIK